jgi:hypothetical protein
MDMIREEPVFTVSVCLGFLILYSIFYYFVSPLLGAEYWMEGELTGASEIPNDGTSNFADAAMFMNVTLED